MRNLQVRVKTDMTSEPVSLTEAKNWCKVVTTADDTLLTLLITAARKALEKYTSSSFGEKELHATWVQMPEDWVIELPYGPIISVDKVYLIDYEGTEELLTVDDDYYLTGDQDIQVVIERFWTSGTSKTNLSVRVEYTAGYGDSNTETLPDELKLAILKQISTDYNFRDNIQDASSTILSNDAKSLAAPYRRKIWF